MTAHLASTRDGNAPQLRQRREASLRLGLIRASRAIFTIVAGRHGSLKATRAVFRELKRCLN